MNQIAELKKVTIMTDPIKGDGSGILRDIEIPSDANSLFIVLSTGDVLAIKLHETEPGRLTIKAVIENKGITTCFDTPNSISVGIRKD